MGQMRARQKSTSAHQKLFGVKVLNYNRAWRAGVSAAEQDFNVGATEDAEWIVTFAADKVDDAGITKFCNALKGHGGECIKGKTGHPSKGGTPTAGITGSKESLEKILQEYEEKKKKKKKKKSISLIPLL